MLHYCHDIIVVFYAKVSIFCYKFLIAVFFFLKYEKPVLLVSRGLTQFVLIKYTNKDRLSNLTVEDLRQVGDL